MPTAHQKMWHRASGPSSMAEVNEDPREVPWHPRYAKTLVGQGGTATQFRKAFASGKPHHAWLVHGPKGIGKATFAYHMAAETLGGDGPQTRRWIESRAHPDLFVLERQLNDAKPRKLKAEISVEDARSLSSFLARTASGNWRVAIIDAADDLNAESANAILKLVEEPPPKVLMFLISQQPGKLLRTLRSRCIRLALERLSETDCAHIINNLPLDLKPQNEEQFQAVAKSGGNPGRALALLGSVGAKTFGTFSQLSKPKSSQLLAIANQFSGRSVGPEEFSIFTEMLQDWVATVAKTKASPHLAAAHVAICENTRITQGFNLDHKTAVLSQLTLVNDALKAS